MAQPQQPELRPFIVYDRMPAGCIASVITNDDTAPLLRPGEVGLIDPSQREPVTDELFLIQWDSGTRSIVEAIPRTLHLAAVDDRPAHDALVWFVAVYNRPKTPEQVAAWRKAKRIIRTVDGPYATEGPHAGYLQSKIVGRVVGILAPCFEEPKRLGGEVRP